MCVSPVGLLAVFLSMIALLYLLLQPELLPKHMLISEEVSSIQSAVSKNNYHAAEPWVVTVEVSVDLFYDAKTTCRQYDTTLYLMVMLIQFRNKY